MKEDCGMDKATAEKTLNIVDNPYTKEILQKCYKSTVKKVHPDCGGSHEQMVEVNEAHSCLLTYFKYQSYVSLSAQPATSNFTNYYNRPKTTEEQYKETQEKIKEVYARKASEEARKASEKMKETAQATAYTTEAFKDFAKAYQDFTYWTSQEGRTAAQQWAKVNKVVDEVESVRMNDIENGENEPNPKSLFWLGIGLRIAFFLCAIVCFISIGSWDFILHFGTFHFMDYWSGDFFSFIFCTVFLIVSLANLVIGIFTDWIAAVVCLIKDAFERKKVVGKEKK